MKRKSEKVREKYITEKIFEKHMANIAKSFVRVDESLKIHGEVLKQVLAELKAIHEENRDFRSSISGLNLDGISFNRKIENLTVRIEKLESKSK